MSAAEDRSECRHAMNWLWGAVHELPAGVLWGARSASAAECAEMMEGLEQFGRLCDRLDLRDHSEFIEVCRWHFEHYPHFLGRARHLVDYAAYVRDRGGCR